MKDDDESLSLRVGGVSIGVVIRGRVEGPDCMSCMEHRRESGHSKPG